jgi:hypothetical protein
MNLKIGVALLLVLAATMAVGTQMIMPAKAQVPSDVDQYALPGGTVFWYADYSTGNQNQFSTNPVSAYPIGGSEIDNTCNGVVAVSSTATGAYGGITHNGEPYAGYYSGNAANDVDPSADGGACHVDPDMWSIGGGSWTNVYNEGWFYLPTQTLNPSTSGTGSWFGFDGWCNSACDEGFGIDSAPTTSRNIVGTTWSASIPQNVGAAIAWPFNQWFQLSILILNAGSSSCQLAAYYNGAMFLELTGSTCESDGTGNVWAIHWGAYFSQNQGTEIEYNADLLLEEMPGNMAIPAAVPTGSGTVASTTTPSTTTPTTTVPVSTTPTLTPTSATVSAYAPGANGLIAEPITATQSGTLSTVGIDVEAAAGDITIGIYSTYGGGELSGLLGQSASTPLVSGWEDLSMPSGISITDGARYYLAFVLSSSSAYIYYGTGTNYYTDYTYGSLPSTASRLSTGECGCAFNMRVTYGPPIATTPTTQTSASTSTPTLLGGTTDTIGGTTGASGGALNYLYAWPITASTSGTLVSIGADIEFAAGNIQDGIYSTYSNGELSGLLGSSSSTPARDGWNELSIPGSVSIVAGTTYYLVLEQSSTSCLVYYVTGTEYYGSNTYGSFPSTTGMLTPGTNEANMRMTYGPVSSTSTSVIVPNLLPAYTSTTTTSSWNGQTPPQHHHHHFPHYFAAAWLSLESGAIMAGLVVASLVGLVYVTPVAYAFLRTLRKRPLDLARVM